MVCPRYLRESFDADPMLINGASIRILLSQLHFLGAQLCQHAHKAHKDDSVTNTVGKLLGRQSQCEWIVINNPDQAHINHLGASFLGEDNFLEARFVDGTKLEVYELVV